jgi:cation diffusion facilitator CzcD-associated flavoprotein CzcO
MTSTKEEPVDNFRRMRVVVIGAGYSGLYMSIRIPEWLRNVDLVTYEQNAGVGGTWWMNRYPGCACDIPCELLIQKLDSVLADWH